MADLMAHAERQIPERMQDGLDCLFIDLALEEEEQVDVGFGMYGFTPVAADGE